MLLTKLNLHRLKRMFFSSINFLCWLLFWYWFHACVTVVAHKRSSSFCQKCRWLPAYVALNKGTLQTGACLYGVHRMWAKTAAVPRATSHVTTEQCCNHFGGHSNSTVYSYSHSFSRICEVLMAISRWIYQSSVHIKINTTEYKQDIRSYYNWIQAGHHHILLQLNTSRTSDLITAEYKQDITTSYYSWIQAGHHHLLLQLNTSRTSPPLITAEYQQDITTSYYSWRQAGHHHLLLQLKTSRASPPLITAEYQQDITTSYYSWIQAGHHHLLLQVSTSRTKDTNAHEKGLIIPGHHLSRDRWLTCTHWQTQHVPSYTTDMAEERTMTAHSVWLTNPKSTLPLTMAVEVWLRRSR